MWVNGIDYDRKTGVFTKRWLNCAALGFTWVLNLFDLFVDEGHQLRFAQSSHFGGSECAVLKEHQRRNTADAKFSGDLSVFIDIHFGDLQFAFIGGRNLVQNRRNHFARPAPFSPVVHQYRMGRFQHFGFKSGIGDVFDEIAGHSNFFREGG